MGVVNTGVQDHGDHIRRTRGALPCLGRVDIRIRRAGCAVYFLASVMQAPQLIKIFVIGENLIDMNDVIRLHGLHSRPVAKMLDELLSGMPGGTKQEAFFLCFYGNTLKFFHIVYGYRPVSG